MEFLTVREYAELKGCSDRQVRSLVSEGKIVGTTSISDRNRPQYEDGKPVEWEIRALTEQENSRIKDDCTVYTTKKGRRTASFDGSIYTKRLTAEAVVYPDLRDAELQASYGVTNEVDLLSAMLVAGEFATLQEAVQQICRFDVEKMLEDKQETKNS